MDREKRRALWMEKKKEKKTKMKTERKIMGCACWAVCMPHKSHAAVHTPAAGVGASKLLGPFVEHELINTQHRLLAAPS